MIGSTEGTAKEPRADERRRCEYEPAVELGSYELDGGAGYTPGLPSGVWRPANGDGPVIVAAHPMPPLPGSMGEWSMGLQWIAEQCDTPGSDVIVAGDFAWVRAPRECAS